jgi:hypothetical protein
MFSGPSNESVTVNQKPLLRTVFLISGIFFLLGLFGILHHEMWLDEMHHWLIAKNSKSFLQLSGNMRYEGHPPAWNIALFLVTRFFSDPVYMQILHILIATVAVAFFVYHAPFSLFLKILIISDYYIIYEFNVISRSYAMGIFITWIICSLFKKSERKFMLIALLSGLLCMVHLFFLFLSLAFLLLLIYELKDEKNKRIIFVAAIYLPFLLVAVFFIIPPPDHFLFSATSVNGFSIARIEKAFSVFIKAFLHIPDFRISNCWNSNFLLREYKSFFIIPSLLYILLPLSVLNNFRSLFIFYFPSTAIVLFLYCSPVAGGVRYPGTVFIIFIAAWWIEKSCGKKMTVDGRDGKRNGSFTKAVATCFLTLLFSTQLISSIIMFYQDFKRPFSNARNAADFIEENNFDDGNIAVSDVAVVSSLRGYLHNDLYLVEAKRYCSFSAWNIYPFQLSGEKILYELERIIKEHPGNWILVTNYLLTEGREIPHSGNICPKLVRSFTGSIVSTENYFIYSVKLSD